MGGHQGEIDCGELEVGGVLSCAKAFCCSDYDIFIFFY
jgi:hypothetical protein